MNSKQLTWATAFVSGGAAVTFGIMGATGDMTPAIVAVVHVIFWGVVAVVAWRRTPVLVPLATVLTLLSALGKGGPETFYDSGLSIAAMLLVVIAGGFGVAALRSRHKATQRVRV